MNNLNLKRELTSLGVFKLTGPDFRSSEFVDLASIDQQFPDMYSFIFDNQKIYLMPLDVPYFFGQYGVLGRAKKKWIALGHGRTSEDGTGINISLRDRSEKLFMFTKN